MSTSLLHRPIAVFDAGIGSYAIVAEIQRQRPRQDIVYFADRASFPYGEKSREALADTMARTFRYLARFDPCAIVMASNAPSITVLETVRPLASVPLYGVFPPLPEAIKASRNRAVGIMGVTSLVESERLADFIEAHRADGAAVTAIDASTMVALVESGAFLFDPEGTQAKVDTFIGALFDRHPRIDVLTLSSTHLPWLKSFFERARPNCRFLDPAERVVASLSESAEGTGSVRTLVTEDERYSVADFRRMLERLGVKLELEVVTMAPREID
ncbi:glutamate racemase [Salinicola halophilus]|uniref:glutamate racemase n=1 Tax=Salinicola halophilus TaxID=184065 RepID=UPI000DA1BD31|nr:aspartate/glutamate racemase family protein [Salinicola halophilus]